MKRKNRQSGSAFVEFALAALLMFSVCGGMFQFGYSMFIYNELTSVVRSASRYGAIIDYTSSSSTPTAAYTTAVKNVAVYGSANISSGTPLVSGLTTANVDVTVTMNGSIPREITVRIINFTVDAIFGRITFHQKPSSTFTYNG